MSTVDIADIDAALGKVRAFLTAIDQNYLAWQNSSVYDRPTPQQKFTDGKIQEQLPLITRIAARADAELATKMQKDRGAPWPYHSMRGCGSAACRSAQLDRRSATDPRSSRPQAGGGQPAPVDLERGREPLGQRLPP
jgi:hypothetical protein